MENNDDELYADLFAYRFALLDIYEGNETEIIKKLKYKLIDWGYRGEELSRIIKDLYRIYSININDDLIDSVRIHVFDYDIPSINHNHNLTLLMNRINELIEIYSSPSNETENQEDIKITVEEDAIEKLPIVKINEDNINCSICMESLNKNEDAKKLQCNHLYHPECIKSYLLNYDYKCPLCRMDVGNHKINI